MRFRIINRGLFKPNYYVNLVDLLALLRSLSDPAGKTIADVLDEEING